MAATIPYAQQTVARHTAIPARKLPMKIVPLDTGIGKTRQAVRPPKSAGTMDPHTADAISIDTIGRTKSTREA